MSCKLCPKLVCLYHKIPSLVMVCGKIHYTLLPKHEILHIRYFMQNLTSYTQYFIG